MIRRVVLVGVVVFAAQFLGSQAVQAEGIRGELPPSGIALASWDGGSVLDLEATNPEVESVWVAQDGVMTGFLLFAPSFVNLEFFALYPFGELPVGTPILVSMSETRTAENAPSPTVPNLGVYQDLEAMNNQIATYSAQLGALLGQYVDGATDLGTLVSGAYLIGSQATAYSESILAGESLDQYGSQCEVARQAYGQSALQMGETATHLGRMLDGTFPFVLSQFEVLLESSRLQFNSGIVAQANCLSEE